jgi:hypothetical protein
MHRRRIVCSGALLLTVAAVSCDQSAASRERTATRREREEASTRASETVRRAATPQLPNRIIYDPPTSLSDSNARRTGAMIMGVDTLPQPTEPAVHSGAPPEKPHG